MNRINFKILFEDTSFLRKIKNGGIKQISARYSLILSALVNEFPDRNFLIVTNDLEGAEYLSQALDKSLVYPEFGVFPYENGIVDSGNVELKFRFWEEFFGRNRKLVVASLKSLFDAAYCVRSRKSISIKVGNSLKLTKLASTLSAFGYERVIEIANRGEFSIKGEIADVFPFSEEHPYRIDFDENVVEKIKIIDPETMLSADEIDSLRIYSSSFYNVCPDKTEKLVKEIRNFAKSESEFKRDLLLSDAEKIMHGENVGVNYYPAFLSKDNLGYETLLDYTKDFTVVFFGDLNFEEFLKNAKNIYDKSLEAGDIVDLGFEKVSLFAETVKNRADFVLSALSGENTLDPGISSMPENFSALSSLKEFVLSYLKEKSVIVITQQMPRVKELFALYELTPETQLSDERGLYLINGFADRGFETDKVIVLTDRELFPHYEIRRSSKKILFGKKISSIEELNEGDYVVHKDFGIGIFRGLKTFIRDGTEKEFLLIEYRNGEKLYVPMERIGYVERYIGDRRVISLNKLHGSEWSKTKQKAAENARMLARKLLRIEAERKLKGGFSFAPFPVEEKILALSFPYELTDDQEAALRDVYRDMESNEPMDRLICGDVGYGKTEIAIRAAFRAVMNGKQVAFLVPTTVLALQHERTLRERLHLFPVEIGMLSRLTPASEKKRILKKLADGTMDIVVGTHRILSRDVKFKDLGLLIIDEEQRFGVKDKEKIKELRANIDLLTLTATPIPRTLHSALLNLKDISLINTPPPGRLPIKTFVLPFSWETVKKAVNFELDRNGQVFIIHNKIEDIYGFAEKFRYALGRDTKIAVAHGKMNKYDLENVMLSFYRGETKVLIATTIIENGLDIPTVNTLIVDGAENFGLSQMYQLRGRIGRSHINAFAYFLFTPDKGLRAISEERLETIKEFTGVGSGIKIAMKDLELRGAGNILGKEQHGHIVSVGYGMYISLLDEAVAELKGKKKIPVKDVQIRIAEKYYLPSDYIPLVAERMEYYRRITSAADLSEVDSVEEELIDKFGKLPLPVKNLLEIGKCEVLMRRLGIKEVYQEGSRIFLSIDKNHTISPRGLEFFLENDKSARIGEDYISFETTPGMALEKLRYVLNLLSKEKVNAL